MNKHIAAAVMGALLAAPLAAACSDHNTDYDAPSETVTEAAFSSDSEAAAEEPKKDSSEEFGKSSAVSEMNRPQCVYITDKGEYVYLSGKNGANGAEDVYILDDRRGNTQELPFPSKSIMLHNDGSRLYYYAPDEGVCEYSGGKSKALSAETAKRDVSVPQRGEFFFTDDEIYFACPSDSGTVIKSMDYTGKLTDRKYELEYKNARIVGIAEVNGRNSLLCTYNIGIREYIRIFDGKGGYTDTDSGSSPCIAGDSLYYIKDSQLCRNTLDGGSEEAVTDRGCISYCFFGDKLYYADTSAVYAADMKGGSEVILKAADLENTDFIESICTADNRLFVSGGKGAFKHSLAEIDEKGSITDMIHSDK